MKLNCTFNDHTPLNLTEEKKQEALKNIRDIQNSLAFFAQRIIDGARKDDVYTHLGLLEFQTADLSKATGYDGILAKQVEARNAEVRKLNQRIHELEDQRGAEVDATAVTAALKRYEDVFVSWYESCAFQYASVEYGPYGIQADFSNELSHTREKGLSRNNEVFAKFSMMTPFIPESEDWDIIKDDYHDELADTDRNRQNLIQLFTSAFPDVVIIEFKARKNDYGSFSLSINVHISFEDIEKLEKKALGE